MRATVLFSGESPGISRPSGVVRVLLEAFLRSTDSEHDQVMRVLPIG